MPAWKLIEGAREVIHDAVVAGDWSLVLVNVDDKSDRRVVGTGFTVTPGSVYRVALMDEAGEELHADYVNDLAWHGLKA